MTLQVQMRTTDRRVWAMKRESDNKFYALVTNPRDYEIFVPDDTIVWACESENPEFSDMLYNVMYRIMQYGEHVDSYFAKHRLGLLRNLNRLNNFDMRELVKPKIELFNKSPSLSPDSKFLASVGLMSHDVTISENDVKPIPGFDRLALHFRFLQDAKYRYIYALALPWNEETKESYKKASLYITAFTQNDPDFRKYLEAISAHTMNLPGDCNTNQIEIDNEDRISRFNYFFEKVGKGKIK